MSVKITNDCVRSLNIGGDSKDSYGLPISEQSPRNNAVNNSEKQTPRGKVFHNGVRVPILKDIQSKYIGNEPRTSCRFDIVETVTTVIKPGTYGPSFSDNASETRHTTGTKRKEIMLRQPTFHSTSSFASRKSDQSVVDKISPYHWSRWSRTGIEGDARDVLYRNTYCLKPESVRYRSLTLPRISNDERPWTVGADSGETRNNVHDSGEYSKTMTIIPQQPRGTVVRFREYMKPVTASAERKSLEVKRFSTARDHSSQNVAAKNVLPLIKQDSRRYPRKTERPLKFESSRFSYSRGGKRDTLFSKKIVPPFHVAFDRDYSSADTFKEYLDSFQKSGDSGKGGQAIARATTRGSQDNRLSIDYHNQILESVTEVNKPPEEGTHNRKLSESSSSTDSFRIKHSPITVEIKQTQKNDVPDGMLDDLENTNKNTDTRQIDGLSSVHGSEIHAHSEMHSVIVPVSSSMVNGAFDNEKLEEEQEKSSSIASSDVLPEAPPVLPGNDVVAPANTPTPVEE